MRRRPGRGAGIRRRRNGVRAELPPEGTRLLDARDVTVRYGGLVAVDRVSVGVSPFEIVGLIGPNGAGKTSLFEALSGFRDPAEGTVWLAGTDVTRWPAHKRAAAGLTRTFQRLELFEHLTVFDNLLAASEARVVEFGMAADVLGIRGRADAAAVNTATEVLEGIGLAHVTHRLAGELPAGLGRLVEIGRALCTRPLVLLLDEPSAGLTESETDELATRLHDLVTSGGPSLFIVEHDVPFVLGLAHRICVMEFGRLIADGTPDEIRRDPEVGRAYLGAAT
jgi:sulfate-transporting ATPase